jgi:hypothetical protein
MTQSYRTCGAPEPSLGGRQDLELQDMWRIRALPCKEAGSGATVHVTAPEQSPSYQDGGIRSHWAHGSLGPHLGWKAGFGVAGHVATRWCTPRSLS